MSTLVARLHPALRPGRRLGLTHSGAPLFSRQGDWDGGGTLHSLAMALALLGKLSDPVGVWQHKGDPEAHFWHHAWPNYLHGMTLSELAGLVWELDAGVRPVLLEGPPPRVSEACTRELAQGWPVIVGWISQHPRRAHAALAVGVEGRWRARKFTPHALLLLDPAEAEPGLAAFNARLELGQAGRGSICVTAAGAQPVTIEGALSIRVTGRRN